MLAALRAYDTVRDPAAIRSWLFSIAARKAVDAHRGRARAPEPTADLEELAGAEDAPPRDDAIWREVRSLPDKQRSAVTLRYLADLSHAEIAEVMGTSEDAARRNVFEGLRRLRAGIDPPRSGGRRPRSASPSRQLGPRRRGRSRSRSAMRPATKAAAGLLPRRCPAGAPRPRRCPGGRPGGLDRLRALARRSAAARARAGQLARVAGPLRGEPGSWRSSWLEEAETPRSARRARRAARRRALHRLARGRERQRGVDRSRRSSSAM